jgi:general secretion pathway protein A
MGGGNYVENQMVLDYYKLAEQPFGVTPDPRFLYLSETHREAMASVQHSIGSGRGFTALIAEPGMGKTTVLFNLLQQLEGATKTAFLFQSQDSPRNFLRNLLLDLGIEDDGQDLVRMHVKLNECLVRETSRGNHLVVVVDEAQNLNEPVLEVVRMLSNFETSREKLMHIILSGQPQLAAKLALPQLQQLRQRVSIVARLQPFQAADTRAYIEHRLKAGGYREDIPLFTDRAFSLIAEYSGGIPRNINNICFNAMSFGCAIKRKTIHAAAVEEVLNDLDLKPLSTPLQVAEYNAIAPSSSNRDFATRPGGKSWGILPRGLGLRIAMASLVGVTAGIGFAVVEKNADVGKIRSTISTMPKLTGGQSADVRDAQVPTSEAKSVISADSVADTRMAGTPSSTGDPLPDRQIANGAPESILYRVGQQQTLYEICMSNFGRYDNEIAKIIRQLNPGLANPRRLHAGQEIRIPTPRSVWARTNVPAAELRSTSALEATKP